MNSSMREYIPFGHRGTVIGRTDDKVIILFDEQFIGGTDIHYHCESYKGAFINPNYLLNLTKKFESVLKNQQNPQGIIGVFADQNNDVPIQEENKETTRVVHEKTEKNK